MGSEDEITKPLNREHQESEFYQSQQTTLQENEEELAPIIEDDIDITKKYQFDGLKPLHLWGYAVGHFYNDLCAAVWFNYLLFYIKTVRNLPQVASYSMLGGQIFDGIATPVVGILSDKTKTKIGKRTPWYIFGTILVTFTFLPIFIYQFVPTKPDPTPENPDQTIATWPQWALYLYFISFPSIFNVGWASVQISNMSLVPSLTCSNSRRDILNSRRNTFTFVANLAVLVMAGIFFTQFTAVGAFEALAFFVAGVGLVTTGFFSYVVREVPLVKRASQCLDKLKRLVDKAFEIDVENKIPQQSSSVKSNKSDHTEQYQAVLKQTKNPKKSVNEGTLMAKMMADEDDMDFVVDRNSGEIKPSVSSMKLSLKAKQLKQQQESENDWKQWFSESMFYVCGVIYMFVRLYCNVMATFLPFYLAYVCELVTVDKNGDINVTNLPISFAIVPMLLYIFSTISSSGVEFLFSKIGRKRTYLIGAIFAAVSTVGFLVTTKNYSWIVYPTACIGGVAQALCLNTGITLISDVIGCRGSQGAFVFGVYSFLDKFLTGIVLFITSELFVMTAPLAKYTIALVPAVSVVIAGICIMLIKTTDDEFKHSNNENDNQKVGNPEMKKLDKELAS